MKSLLCAALALSFLGHQQKKAFAQHGNVPSVIALYPNEIETDSLAATELKNYENEKAITEDFRKGFLREGLAPNWKIIRQNELAFMEHQDFFSMLVLTITHELTYKEADNRTNLLIYPIKERCAGSLLANKKIADHNKISWVINFLKAEARMVEGKRRLTISVQLYNAVSPRFFLDKKFSIDSGSLTELENCQEIWGCLSQQLATSVVIDLMDKIERNIRLNR
ncbi:MAG: hypothetical protein HY015_08830 [Bacteroidetes bacterium]|nr:hypothetical protein [Bacteroidota bacterium]